VEHVARLDRRREVRPLLGQRAFGRHEDLHVPLEELDERLHDIVRNALVVLVVRGVHRREPHDGVRSVVDTQSCTNRRVRREVVRVQEGERLVPRIAQVLVAEVVDEAFRCRDDVGGRQRELEDRSARLAVVGVEDPDRPERARGVRPGGVACEHEVGTELAADAVEAQVAGRQLPGLRDARALRPSVGLVRDPEVVEQLKRDLFVARQHTALVTLRQEPPVQVSVEVRVGGMDDVEEHSHDEDPYSAVGPVT
jgi:hypothetical protein